MIQYVIGDATSFSAGKKGVNKVLAHVCNDYGGWGAGIVVAISKKWRFPEAVYRSLSSHALGTVQLVGVEQGKYVCNMIAQKGNSSLNYAACNLEALVECFAALYNILSLAPKTEVHMPRVGCGLGGRTWDEIEPILFDGLGVAYNVFVYDLPSK